jgi:ABC-type uncharacterized transport system ATPase subunit
VTLKVRPGTVHALLGENGAGKSTLVKCIMGYYRPTRASVLVDEREQDDRRPPGARARHRHGLPALHPGAGMTVAENLVLGARRPAAVIDWKPRSARRWRRS